jgi:flagellar basal-body rod modification protein FlgD
MTTTSPIPATAAAPISSSANPGSTATATAGLTQNFNTFLTLLTTQLQNQDPLSPMDTNQFTQQLVSFSEVEQQINTNSNLQQLIALQGAGESIAALPLVGQKIEYNSATAPLSNGEANFVYSLPSAAASTALTVVNASGKVVYTQPGDSGAGTHSFTWNGKTPTGVQLPDGNYTLQIQAVGAAGGAIAPSIASIGTVQAVGVENGTATFTVNGMAVPLSQLVTVNPTLTKTN